MDEKLFTGLWVGALAGIAVFPVLGWVTPLQILAFGLWWWVIMLKQERDAAWGSSHELRRGQIALQERLRKYEKRFGPLPENKPALNPNEKGPEHMLRAELNLQELFGNLPQGTELEITLPPKE